MAFYTALDDRELQLLLQRYGISNLTTCTGASDGIENSTYFLQSGEQQWILTLFEEITADELPFFVRLMNWLFERDLPVAHALTDNHGAIIHTLSGKPALLFPRLSGKHPRNMTLAQCRAIGEFLGRMHALSEQYPERRANHRGTAWLQHALQRLSGYMTAAQQAVLQSQIANAIFLRELGLPAGLIHGDLFHDNALFDGDQLCGVIDFYNACTDMLALDLAIVINDWCALPEGGLDMERYRVIVAAYTQYRPLTAAEQQHWQAVLQLAATRFWVSRLLSEKLPARPDVQHAHKPSTEYAARLHYHTLTALSL
ncbi:MAG: homoserine kinase [Pseudomonadales bacterium]|nr:homoserine kinase [Pseudomonadales bacterium]